MNSPERVLKTVNHEEPDRVPSFESAFTNNTIMKHYGIKPQPISRQKVPDKILKQVIENPKLMRGLYEPVYEFYRKVGLDLVPSLTSMFPRKILENNTSIDEYGRIMRSEVYEKDGTVISGYVGGYFKSFEDYENWEQPDPSWEARLIHFKLAREIQKEKNDEIFSVPSVGALMECSWESFGLATFSKILARPKQAKKVFDDRGNFTLEVVKMLAENDAQIVLLWDDYGFKNGLFMSPLNYRKYVFPWIKKICDVAHKQNCKILLHSDGDLMEIIEDIVNCGVDILNPIESTTANPEYDIFQLKKKYGNKLTFAGNLSPIMLAMGDISEIEVYAKRLIREVAPGGGYIFSSGHSINPAITLDRFEAMQNIRRKYGKYPISVPD
jgi:uroporphyrinogen decarboxylase